MKKKRVSQMKKMIKVLLVVVAVVVVSACSNSPESNLEGKEFYVEFQDGPNSNKVIENTVFFDKDGMVTATSTEITTVQSVGRYELDDELINDKYYLLKADVNGLACSSEFLLDPETMVLYEFQEEDGKYEVRDKGCIQQLIEK